MDWTQTLSIMATVISAAFYIHQDMKSQGASQGARTDKLYEMFIDLIKENKK